MATDDNDAAGADFTTLLNDVARRSAAYLGGLDGRSVAPPEGVVAGLADLTGPLPRNGVDAAEIVRLLDETAAPATIASAGGRYFGFVTGGSLPAALAADWMAGAWDQNSFSDVSSPLAPILEACVLGWLVDVLALPEGTGGALVTGATMANVTALAAARHGVLADVQWDVEERGLIGAPPVTVLVGEEAHARLVKALVHLGFGRATLIRVPVDDQGRMLADALPDIQAPAIVCLQAGNVNSGAFDPAPEIIPAAAAAGAWVHVDGAFGLWARAAPDRAVLAAGYEGADSWAVDAHKWLNVPYDCGIALVRRPETLAAAMSIDAAYLLKGGRPNPIDFTPESSRRLRAADVWAALKSLGRRGLADLIERNCRQAARFAEGLAAAGFEVLNEVALNQVLVSFGDDETTARVIQAVQADGTCWCGGTHWRGRAAMRISVSSWATRDQDIEQSLAAVIRVAGAAITRVAGADGDPS